jgi:phosphatidylinositol-3,4,5-trisphosphate 3-phosphatase and dual-specificity protein phosphatase PTEN
MCFPSSGLEGMYRNSITDVKKFLQSRHKNNYKVYNLCIEPDRQYPAGTFEKMQSFGFHDHTPPTLTMMENFCKEVDEYLKISNLNIAVIHCKAGKGRTGTMICAYLLYSDHFRMARGSLMYYAMARTNDGAGVTIPSQIRYVYYFEHMLHKKKKYIDLPQKRYFISRIYVGPGPKTGVLSSFSSLS